MKNQLELGIDITLLDKNGNVKYHIAKKADTLLKQFGTLLAGRLFKYYSTCKDTDGNPQIPQWNGFGAPGYFGVNAYAGDDNSGLLAGNGSSIPADLTNTSYASASSFATTGYEADKAFDNIPGVPGGNRWASAGTFSGPEWLKQDFGAGNEKTIVKYTLSNNGLGTEIARDWTFEGSNDDSTWDTLDTQTGQNPDNLTVYTFSNSTAYRYYRIYITAKNVSGNPVSIGEMEMMEAGPTPVSYTDYCLAAKISHSISGLYYPVMQVSKDSPSEGHETVTRLFENRGAIDIEVNEIGLVYITGDIPHVKYMIARDIITPVTLAPTDVMNTKYIISWLP